MRIRVSVLRSSAKNDRLVTPAQQTELWSMRRSVATFSDFLGFSSGENAAGRRDVSIPCASCERAAAPTSMSWSVMSACLRHYGWCLARMGIVGVFRSVHRSSAKSGRLVTLRPTAGAMFEGPVCRQLLGFSWFLIRSYVVGVKGGGFMLTSFACCETTMSGRMMISFAATVASAGLLAKMPQTCSSCEH